MITFSCPGCGKSLSVKDEFAGRRTKCPKCSNPLDVPSSPRAAARSPKSAAAIPVATPALAEGSRPATARSSTSPKNVETDTERSAKTTVELVSNFHEHKWSLWHGPYLEARIKLPKICACCGSHASTTVKKVFSWLPLWAWFLPGPLRNSFIISTSASLPFCSPHRNYFVWRGILFWSPVCIGPVSVLAMLVHSLAFGKAGIEFLLAIIGLAMIFIVPALIFSSIFIYLTSIRRTQRIYVDQNCKVHLILRNVSKAFAQAVEVQKTRAAARQAAELARDREAQKAAELPPQREGQRRQPPSEQNPFDFWS